MENKTIITEENNTMPKPSDSLSDKVPVDILDRKPDVDRMLSLLDALSDTKSSTAFALNGKWGSGKTFVLDMLERELIPYVDSGKYLVFHYNCWQYDYYEEPLVAIVSAMLDYIDEVTHLFGSKIRGKGKALLQFAGNKLKEIGGTLVEAKLGINPITIAEDWKSAKEQAGKAKEASYSFDQMRSFSKSIKNIRERLKELAEEQTLIIIVDELDRCLPEYAIKVLERLHHLFAGVKNCIIILSVSREQLNDTVKRIFGEKTDAGDYLKKFINFEVNLTTGTVNNSFITKYEQYFKQFASCDYIDEMLLNKYLSAMFSGTDPRSQDRIMGKVITLHKLLPERETRDIGFACFEVLMFWLKEREYGFGDTWVNLEGHLDFSDFPEQLESVIVNTFSKADAQIFYNAFVDENIENVQYQYKNSLAAILAWYNERTFTNRHLLIYKTPDNGIMENNLEDFKRLKKLWDVIA